MKVEVFKTNIVDSLIANSFVFELMLLFPSAQINFDLDDCDKILRIKTESICVKTIQRLFSEKGKWCELLDD
ncbi:hypothetical protein A5893_07485 [Pedobacter psychrophilus]|uniref:Uncharacterized protein n=1 Tax=Pedobacter psychrophilus TaxID=1826909 RepID=A0A179DID2_9SPHI|nr:hypothetical protein [Pedobacter psychrophilus]OAQ40771.1 hypothetical protein A5893_07485 [Pedobacter psychrophilus]